MAEPVADDRPLGAGEAELVRWLLDHGNPDAAAFLPQLADVRVVSRCPCGCASIDFSVGGVEPSVGSGLHILADYEWQASDGYHFGVFVFARGGQLAGLEVWSMDGLIPASVLPTPEQLKPLDFAPT